MIEKTSIGYKRKREDKPTKKRTRNCRDKKGMFLLGAWDGGTWKMEEVGEKEN
jgi:hypothetical protein